jgi:TRAP-type C4-dicarboxylate transport system permease small subunit
MEAPISELPSSCSSICYDVFMRYLFNRPTTWATDFSEYTLLYITFLAAGWLLREDGHARMTLVLDHLRPNGARLLNLFTSLAGAGVCAVLLWKTGWTTWDAYQVGTTMFRSVPVPQFVLWWIIPFGFFLLLLQFLRGAYRIGAAVWRGPSKTTTPESPAHQPSS